MPAILYFTAGNKMTTHWPVEIVGNARNPALLFLHGFMGSSRDWLTIAATLADEYFCILPDLPGHGTNTHLSLDAALDFDILCVGLEQLLGGLSLQQATWVGYSMGGRAALYFAVKYPHRVEKLVIESANPGIENPVERDKRAALDDRRALQLLAGGMDSFVESWYNLELFASLKRFPQLWEPTKKQRKLNNPQWAAKIIRELSPGRQPSLWPHLSGLNMPVLLLAGGLDEKYTALVGQMEAMIPAATVHVVPNAGHNIHLEQPQDFAGRLKRFVRSQPESN
ncbi:MAG: 2-succinyl-6-hydroxy-2,4-cyclohexadiene-1-carboxylate synthase [Chloroflexi bacterium]|nr:MAG: 2-succinyl-6-hydroxy-2,4-cyclohexadiene-1-carboxylate synthase [Chloroflexota bacterium]